MIISLITAEEYRTLQLPERCEGLFTLRDKKGEMLFSFRGMGKGWKPEACDGCRIVRNDAALLRDGMLLNVRIHQLQEEAYLCAEEYSPGYAYFARLATPDQITLTIGSAGSNSVVCTSPHISEHHCDLICRNRVWTVRDADSGTGTFVNGRRVREKRLEPGDLVSLMNQKFIVLPGMLALNRPWKRTKITVRTMSILPEPSTRMDESVIGEKRKAWFRRAPRFVEEVQETSMEVENPRQIQTQKNDGTRALLSIGPSVTSGLSMLFAGIQNPIFGLGMMASSVLWPSLQRMKGSKLMKEENEKILQKYKEYLQGIETELDNLTRRQTETLKRAHPELLQETRTLLQSPVQLWNRRADQPDCLALRLGRGDIPVRVNITFPREDPLDISDNPMQEMLHELRNRERMLTGVPIAVNLADFQSIGISGPANEATLLTLNMMMQMAIHVGYDELKIALLGHLPGPMKEMRFWPHTWTDDGSVHLTAETEEELNRLIPELDEMVNDLALDKRQTWLVVLITDRHMAQSALLDRLLFRQDMKGVRVISLAPERESLPRRVDAAVILENCKGSLIWQGENKREMVEFRTDDPAVTALTPITELLANTFLENQEDAFVLPRAVSFLSVFRVDDVEQLNLLHRWDSADPTRKLICPIGICEDGSLCTLDLHENADGPHGLVAGTTGSGKSETLMTYILSMAVCYSPEDVAFVMIDYKGGGMAHAFEHLPHTAGIITNLDGNEIQRSLLSIQSEMDRRQRIFTQAQKDHNLRKMDIYDYQRLYKEKLVKEPVPHLIIISDEFAELKMQEPEFLQQLIRAARIGRSLGIHLILATQKPAGVVDDQIWSNTNFRLCLRVQDSRDSQEVLKSPEAAELTAVGSMYKQVGSGRAMIKAQSAWTGADYLPGGSSLPDCGVEVLDAVGSVIRAEMLPGKGMHSGMNQLDATVTYIIRNAEAMGLKAASLWQPALEAEIPLSHLRKKYQVQDIPWMPEPVLGELDDPAQQKRSLVRVPLSEGKHTLIYGGYGSGKRMALTTLLEDLLLHHSAEELHVYLLDMADDGLEVYRDAPQVGDVITARDEEKMSRFLCFLEEEMDRRRVQLSAGAINLELKDRLRQADISRILVIIHALDTLQNQLGDEINQLIHILAESARYGIHFLATTQTAGGLRFQLQQYLPQRYVLQMDLDDDYISILGRTGGMKPSQVRGRGILRDEEIYEFQTASGDEPDPMLMCQRLKEGWSGKTPQPVRILPEQVTPADLAPFLRKEAPMQLPVGLYTEDVTPAFWQLDEQPAHIVIGDVREAETLMMALMLMAQKQGVQARMLQAGDRASEEAVHRMFARCRALHDSGTDDGAPPLLVMIPSMQQLKSFLSGDAWEELDAMLWKAKPVWRYTFLLADTARGFEKFRFTEVVNNGGNQTELNRWFADTLNLSDGLILGESDNQNLIQLNTYLRNERPWPFGYLIHSGKPRQVKLISNLTAMP